MNGNPPPESQLRGRTDPDDFEDEEDLLRWSALAIVFVGLASVAGLAWLFSKSELLKSNFQAVVGLPMAGLTALFLVLVLQQIEGKIEFKAVGFTFKGASGPVILWIMCFLAMVLGIKTLWIAK